MVFKDFCILVHWANVASALEGLSIVRPCFIVIVFYRLGLLEEELIDKKGTPLDTFSNYLAKRLSFGKNTEGLSWYYTGELGYDGLNRTRKIGPSYAKSEYLICIGLGPSISSVICKNPSYSGPSYPSSPVHTF